MDTSKIIQRNDFEKLDECIPFLIQSSVGNLLNVRILDPAISRVYDASQLCLQYLLFCTKYLDKSVYTLRENLYNYQKKTVRLEEDLAKRDEEILQLEKKLKRHDVLNQQIFPCKSCTKNFLSATLLENHILRKHPPVPQQEFKDKDSNLINTIKLELEIKQLKERLNLAEKELMESSKSRAVPACEVCVRNARKTFHSIAVQSNFEEKEKDDFEKDEITQLLHNQMRQFEEWKTNEELRYRAEINELRSKLDDTIDAMKHSTAQRELPAPVPMPAPRILTLSEKAVGTAKSTESLADQQDEWKNRYELLAKSYEAQQEQMSSTISNIERSYDEKISKIEESVKNLKLQQAKPPEVKSKPVVIPPEVRSKGSAEKHEKPLSPKVIRRAYIDDSTSLSSSESEAAIKMQSPKIVQVAQANPEPVIQPHPKLELQSFSAQKFVVKAKPEKKVQSKTSKETARDLFNSRLHLLGISKGQKMNKAEFDRVQDSMANMRDDSKKKNKSFFITRKKIHSKVDKIFQQKYKYPSGDVEPPKSSKKNSEFGASFKAATEPVIVESKPIEVKDIEDSPQKDVTSQAFREDLQKMLEKRLPAAGSVSKVLEVVPSKKKVLFDLKNLDEPKTFEDISELAEEDSDFDISSFASEVEDVK